MSEHTTWRKDPRSEQPGAESFRARPALAPAVDVYENAEEVLLVADLPGIEPAGLGLSFEAGQLTIEATTQQAGRPALLGDGRAYDYRRSFLLPEGIDASRIVAELKDGVLQVHLPKAEPARPRRIAVTGA